MKKNTVSESNLTLTPTKKITTPEETTANSNLVDRIASENSKLHDPDTNTKNSNYKFESNRNYFTISIYALCVITLGTIIVYSIVNFDATKAAISRFLNILSPFIMAFFIAYILHPIVVKINKLLKKIKFMSDKAAKILSIIISYLLVLGIMTVTLIYVMPELYNSLAELTSANRIDAMIKTVTSTLEGLEAKFPSIDFAIIESMIEDALPQILSFGTNMLKDLVPLVFNASVFIAKAIVNLLLSIVISVYMLSDKSNIGLGFKKILYAFMPMKKVDNFIQTSKECNSIFNSFIIGKSLDSLIIGIICFIAMNILKLPYAILLSVIVGITNMIPYFGPFIGAIPGVVLYLLISPIKSIIFAFMILVLQQFDGLYLGPKILGSSTGLKPLWVIFAITLGGAYAGVIGMFLGVPVVAVISFLLQKLIHNKLKKKNIIIED